jgi:two-component system NarL family sensor kinase
VTSRRSVGDDAPVIDAVPPRPELISLSSVRARQAIALAGGSVVVASGILALILHLAHVDVWPTDLDPYWRSAVVWAIAVGGPGAALAWVRPAHPIGWLVFAAGAALGVGQLFYVWSVLALEVAPGVLWFHPAVVWVGTWIWVPGYVLVPTIVLLLVPDGRLPSPGWRWVAGFQVAALAAATAGFAFTRWDRMELPITWRGLDNPVGVSGAEHLLAVSLPLVALGVAGSVGALVVRFRRAEALERQQLKWVLLGALLTVLVGTMGFAAPPVASPWLAAAAILPLVAGTIVAVLRHRLWQVEAVIARSAVAAVLTLLVVATYLTVVWLAGARTGPAGAPLVALVVVAFGLQPVRVAVQRQVNRLLYGQRDDPYEVLAALGQRLEGAAGSGPGGEALPGVARTVAEALRLPYIGVVADGELVSAHGERPASVEAVPLVHGGEQVGALDIGIRRGESRLGPEDHRLLDDVARRLAGAVHNLQLTRDLVASRQAIVGAREEERRRLHRDLHDDLGPALASLVLQLETAHDLVASDPAAARALLRRLKGHARGTVDATRRIVTDLRPANLDELGIAGALDELAARFRSPQLSVSTVVEPSRPLPAAVEVVLLRVAAEALNNTARHSGASHCRLELRDLGAAVELRVEDDGTGVQASDVAGVGLHSMRQRVEEIGGTCSVERQTVGTLVSAVLPATV